MKLVIVTSSAPANQVQRILTESSLNEVVALLRDLGIKNWQFYSKGKVAIESDTKDLFIAIGPEKSRDKKEFVKAVKNILPEQTRPVGG